MGEYDMQTKKQAMETRKQFTRSCAGNGCN